MTSNPAPAPAPAPAADRAEEEEEEVEVEEKGRKRGRLQNEGGGGGAMQRYLITVEYVGSRYFGFQKQKGQQSRTIQGALEEAFYKFVGKPVESVCSSRTDTGVHALKNVCHVDVERVSKRKPGEILSPHEPEVVKRALNHFLQCGGEEVQVVDVRCVPQDFHARFQAKERTYHYRIIISKDLPVFERERAWHVEEDLDLGVMQKACKMLVGHHDFSSFRASGCQAKSPVKSLDELHVCEMPSWPSFPTQEERLKQENTSNPIDGLTDPELGDEQSTAKQGMNAVMAEQLRSRCYVITARARSFLYHQVRLMVGLLKAVGAGNVHISKVKDILEARSVTQTPAMAPACGLYLADVKYEFEDL